MFSKANLQISNVWKRQNPEFQCKLKPKSRILVFGKVKIENSGVWKSQNLEFQSLKMSKSRFHKNCDYTGKILKLLCERCNFVKFDIHFLGLPWEIFLGVTTDNLLHLQCLKNVRKSAICFKLFWYKIFVHWKLKLLNVLVNSVLIAIIRGNTVTKSSMRWSTSGLWRYL